MVRKYIFPITTILVLLFAVHTTNAQNYLVNNAGDAPDNDLTDGVCQTAFGSCTLRAAIEQANADIFISNFIDFSLASGTQIIINDELLVTDVNMTINADFGNDGIPDIIIAAGAVNINGFHITGANNTIQGFNLIDFQGPGTNAPILINGGNGNRVISNYIGTDIAGGDFGVGMANFRSIRIINGAQ
ncbi:MAG: hypothetical protein DRI71_12400, partial [Bacteroidetes bacterium]